MKMKTPGFYAFRLFIVKETMPAAAIELAQYWCTGVQRG
jgi:hypothetical protein